MKNLEQLINEVIQITASGLPFMEGKEKLEVKGNILDKILTVDNHLYTDYNRRHFRAYNLLTDF